jgi:hypothetical protein
MWSVRLIEMSSILSRQIAISRYLARGVAMVFRPVGGLKTSIPYKNHIVTYITHLCIKREILGKENTSTASKFWCVGFRLKDNNKFVFSRKQQQFICSNENK